MPNDEDYPSSVRSEMLKAPYISLLTELRSVNVTVAINITLLRS